MIDLFRQLKLEYKEYLILFKSGSFYISFDEDATILNNIFNYKITELKNNIKVGFPISLIDINKKIIKEKEFNYLVVEDKKIVYKYDSNYNMYDNYVRSVFSIISFNYRINKINNIIKSINDDKLKDELLLKIENEINEFMNK